MSLLQSPERSLDQIEWYLNNQSLESFPGAFLLAAGNLSRQVLEQILFILAFYSRLPRNRYLKANDQLRTANDVLTALKSADARTGKTYLQLARNRGPRIAKFARNPRSLDLWRRQFNEPSHFRNPPASRKTRERHIREFIRRIRQIIDYPDHYLITAAVNEIKSNGTIQAVLGNDPANTPGVQVTVVMSPRQLSYQNGRLSLKSQKFPMQIIPDDKDIPIRWKNQVILVQHSHSMSLRAALKTKSGRPIDLTSGETMIASLSQTPNERRAVRRKLAQFGLKLVIKRR